MRFWARAALAAATALALFYRVSTGIAEAESLQDQLRRVQERQKAVQLESQRRLEQLSTVQGEVRAAQVSYTRAQGELSDAQAELARAEADLAAGEIALDEAEAELRAATERLGVAQAQLGQRTRALYLKGRVTYLEVLMGASSFGDFLSRFQLLQAVVRQDSTLVRDVRQIKSEVDVRRTQAEIARDALVTRRQAAQMSRDRVAGKVAAVSELRRSLENEAARTRAELDQLERESKQLGNDIRKLEEQIARELGQLILSYPVQTPAITSHFGWRFHPILKENRLHAGTDFAARTGQNVLAAAAGTVIVAGWQSGYGNVVVISHGRVSGKAISTLYAHNSKLKVSPGQQVQRGDVIALAGSTGLSTGPHVHFEVRSDGDPVDPLKWLRK